MAAPSGIVWGSVVKGSTSGRQGRIGVYKSITSSATETTVNIQIWFSTIYSCSDGSNNFYCDIGTATTSATTKIGSVNIDHTVASGEGWSTSNHTRLYNVTKTYTHGTSAKTYKVYAKFNGIDMLSSKTMYIDTTFTVPKLASYTITYNANGGSGAPASQTKYYDKNLSLSSTKPTRTNYVFIGWGTSSTDTTKDYDPGATYSTNANLTLYAIWKAPYTVTYNANGGSGAPASQTKIYNKALTLSSTKPTRANYTFLGWGTSSGATTVAYKPGATYSTNANLTLYAIWKASYKKPRITNMSVARCDSAGNLSDEGTYARVTFSWACDKTVSSIKIEWKSASNSSSTTVSASGTSGTVSNKVVGANALTTESTYTIIVTVTDSDGSSSLSKTLPGANFFIDLLDDNGAFGVAFGKPAERAGYIESAKPMVFNNNLNIYGIDTDGTPKQALTPVNTNGNTVIGYGNYEKKSGDTNVYGNNVNITSNNHTNLTGNDVILTIGNASSANFRPYRRPGDSITVSINTAGYVTSAGTKVNFIIPMAVPPIGITSVSAASGSGFILRQGSSYTHGSTSDVGVKATSIEVTRTVYNGLRITATFSDATNVTNNDAIGIYWNGTITFN